MGRFLPPDPSRGDERTLGGYMAVHARPAAFEGSDGASYSVAIETDRTGEPDAPWGAYLLFVCWSRGQPRVTGHLETPYLAHGSTPDEARDAVGAMSLEEVKARLDSLLADRAPPPERPWWEVMRELPDEDGR
jgi:hypothetical protein